MASTAGGAAALALVSAPSMLSSSTRTHAKGKPRSSRSPWSGAMLSSVAGFLASPSVVSSSTGVRRRQGVTTRAVPTTRVRFTVEGVEFEATPGDSLSELAIQAGAVDSSISFGCHSGELEAVPEPSIGSLAVFRLCQCACSHRKSRTFLAQDRAGCARSSSVATGSKAAAQW